MTEAEIAALVAKAVAAAVAAQPKAFDWPPVIAAITGLVTAILAPYIIIRQGKQDDDIKTVKLGVDGLTDKLVAAKTGEARALAILEVHADKVAEQGVADAAVLKELAKAPVVTPAAEAVAVTETKKP